MSKAISAMLDAKVIRIDQIEHVRPFLVPVFEAGERSAHLEDARAGCEFCAQPEIYGAARVRKGRRDVRWEHSTPDGGTYLCERPEVRDALSRSGE